MGAGSLYSVGSLLVRQATALQHRRIQQRELQRMPGYEQSANLTRHRDLVQMWWWTGGRYLAPKVFELARHWNRSRDTGLDRLLCAI